MTQHQISDRGRNEDRRQGTEDNTEAHRERKTLYTLTSEEQNTEENNQR